MSEEIRALERRIVSLEKRLCAARCRTGLLLLLGGAGLVLAMRAAPGQDATERQRFTEIDVERINIVEPDGRLGLVLANKGRLPDVIIDGVEHDTGRKGSRGPGMLFFNHRGDECGGLVYSSIEREAADGAEYRASAHFAFDQYRNDQVVFLSYADNGSTRTSGLYVVDRPTSPNISEMLEMRRTLAEASEEERSRLQDELQEAQARGELGAQRVFIGAEARAAMVRLKDTVGRDRIRLIVDAENVARLEFLDEEGNVVHRVPDAP